MTVTAVDEQVVLRLRNELEAGVLEFHRKGRTNYFFSYALVVIGFICSLIAGAIGLLNDSLPTFLGQNAATLAGIFGLIPAMIALLASTLKLQNKANLHYRNHYERKSLLRHLDYTLVGKCTPDDLKFIAEKLSEIERGIDSEWASTAQFDWNSASGNQAS